MFECSDKLKLGFLCHNDLACLSGKEVPPYVYYFIACGSKNFFLGLESVDVWLVSVAFPLYLPHRFIFKALCVLAFGETEFWREKQNT